MQFDVYLKTLQFVRQNCPPFFTSECRLQSSLLSVLCFSFNTNFIVPTTFFTTCYLIEGNILLCAQFNSQFPFRGTRQSRVVPSINERTEAPSVFCNAQQVPRSTLRWIDNHPLRCRAVNHQQAAKHRGDVRGVIADAFTIVRCPRDTREPVLKSR